MIKLHWLCKLKHMCRPSLDIAPCLRSRREISEAFCTEHISMTLFSWHFFKLLLWVSIISQICCSDNVRETACTSTNSRRLSSKGLIQRGNDTSEAKHCEPAHKASICDQHWGMDKAATIPIVRYIFTWNPLNCFSIPILLFVLMFLLLYESFAFDRLLICRDTLIIP